MSLSTPAVRFPPNLFRCHEGDDSSHKVLRKGAVKERNQSRPLLAGGRVPPLGSALSRALESLSLATDSAPQFKLDDVLQRCSQLLLLDETCHRPSYPAPQPARRQLNVGALRRVPRRRQDHL